MVKPPVSTRSCSTSAELVINTSSVICGAGNPAPDNRIVNAYIEFAELQALNRRPMTMREWIAKLDDFLKLSERDLLTHASRISAESAKAKAESEYDRYHVLTDSLPRPVDADFERAIKQIQSAKKTQSSSPTTKRKQPNRKNP